VAEIWTRYSTALVTHIILKLSSIISFNTQYLCTFCLLTVQLTVCKSQYKDEITFYANAKRSQQATMATSILIAVSRWTWVSCSFFLHTFWKKPFADKWHWLYETNVLPVNHPTVWNNEGHTAHIPQPVTWPHLYFIQPRCLRKGRWSLYVWHQ